jgi:hypothetical protein
MFTGTLPGVIRLAIEKLLHGWAVLLQNVSIVRVWTLAYSVPPNVGIAVLDSTTFLVYIHDR